MEQKLANELGYVNVDPQILPPAVTIENTNCMSVCVEKHYKPDELADILGYSVDTIYRIFRNEPGVLEVGNDERMHRRKKKSIRIPHSVYVRWHERHRATKKTV